MNRRDLFLSATEAAKNVERYTNWRYKYVCRLGRVPDGNITAHRIACARYLQELRETALLAARPAGTHIGRALFTALRGRKCRTL